MAKMYPSIGPRDNQSKYAEPIIYSLLKEKLSDEFHIIHSVPWLSYAAKEFDSRNVPSGEIDFLIFHPENGVLAIEVKGGHLKHNENGFVYVKSGDKIDPVNQVRRGAHGLSKWLQESGFKTLRIGYCIAFPDSRLEEELLPPGLIDKTAEVREKIVIDIQDKSSIGKRIEEIMLYWKKTLAPKPLSENIIKNIIRRIIPEADYRPCWSVRIENDTITWLKLTEQQKNSLIKIEGKRNFILSGWPGTGKTLIGIEIAKRHSNKGQKVLFITFNRMLSNKISFELKNNTNCSCYTFHQLCDDATKFINRKIPVEKEKEWFNSKAPSNLKDSIHKGFLKNYDFLIVDESQAICFDWWKILLEEFFKKKVLALCDETQVFSFDKSISLSDLMSLMDTKPFYLTQSLRIPKSVHNRLESVVEAEYQLINQRPLEDDTLEEIVCLNPNRLLKQTVEQLIADGISRKDIKILYTDIPPARSSEVSGVDLHSIAKFRGLESPV